MPGRFFTMLLISACWLCGIPATADVRPGPGIIGKDDRVPASGNAPPWQAIGQVNIGGYRTRGICTGTLVAPRIVLTAAHCVMNPRTKKPFLLDTIHFSAGVFRDQTLGHATAGCLVFPPGYTYRGPSRLLPDLPIQRVPVDSFKDDWALIVLDTAIDGVAPVAVAEMPELGEGAAVSHASYPANRRFILSVQRGCHVLSNTGELVATDCDSNIGSSGGPLLIESEGGLAVAGVLSGMIESTASIFAPVPSWEALSKMTSCPGIPAEQDEN